jgi:uncharacterized protein YkwD
MFVFPKQSFLPILLCLIFSFSSCSSNEEVLEELYIEEQIVAMEGSVYIESTEFEIEILALINKYRVSIKLPLIKPLNIIKVPSYDHTVYMIERSEISHDQFSNRANYLEKNASILSCAENVASGYKTAESLVKGWIASEGHRKNIEGDFNYFDVIARQNNNGNWYYTNIFVKKR